MISIVLLRVTLVNFKSCVRRLGSPGTAKIMPIINRIEKAKLTVYFGRQRTSSFSTRDYVAPNNTLSEFRVVGRIEKLDYPFQIHVIPLSIYRLT